MAPSVSVQSALDLFITRWLSLKQTDAFIEYDPTWPSECYVKPTPEEGEPCQWQPVKRSQTSDMFARLSQALEVDIHPDLATYYSAYYSNHLEAQAKQGDLTLLQVWNEEDMERLRSNLIGHALNKTKLKQPLTFFFAITEPDDGILSIRNDDGTIWLEYPGKKNSQQIADSLSAFLDSLTPK